MVIGNRRSIHAGRRHRAIINVDRARRERVPARTSSAPPQRLVIQADTERCSTTVFPCGYAPVNSGTGHQALLTVQPLDDVLASTRTTITDLKRARLRLVPDTTCDPPRELSQAPLPPTGARPQRGWLRCLPTRPRDLPPTLSPAYLTAL